jgi:hypothetical protein
MAQHDHESCWLRQFGAEVSKDLLKARDDPGENGTENHPQNRLRNADSHGSGGNGSF